MTLNQSSKYILRVVFFCIAQGQMARIDAVIHVDPARQIAPVDLRVYSSFIEHLGKCIYGGVVPYPDDQPCMISKGGFRKDVLELVRDELKISAVRWPGGNFVS